jgi:hypothetical protein
MTIINIKSHYIDKDLVKKGWIAKHMINLNYDSVIQVSVSNLHTGNDVSSGSITYHELTKREGGAYRDALGNEFLVGYKNLQELTTKSVNKETNFMKRYCKPVKKD